MENFTIDLDVYAGPLDLLLYLVRREELDLADVSLAKITNQYIDFIEVLEVLDIDGVGDFLEIAALLVEMKAKAVLPNSQEETDTDQVVSDEHDDQLVVRLLEYKRYRDAASVLEERAIDWQMRYPVCQTICLHVSSPPKINRLSVSKSGTWSVRLVEYFASVSRLRRRP